MNAFGQNTKVGPVGFRKLCSRFTVHALCLAFRGLPPNGDRGTVVKESHLIIFFCPHPHLATDPHVQ